jgi:hypothetical protein
MDGGIGLGDKLTRGMGPAEAAVARAKAEADKIWGLAGKAMGEAAGSALLDKFAHTFGGKAGSAMVVEADQLTRGQLDKLRALREGFDPIAKVRRELAELDVILKRGGFNRPGINPLGGPVVDQELLAMARGKALKDALGGGPDMSKGASIATAGSADAVGAIINAANAGAVRAEDKLLAGMKAQEAVQKQMRDLLKRLNDLIEKKKVPGVF